MVDQQNKIFCDKHKDQICSFLHIDLDNKKNTFEFFCNSCVSRNQGNIKALIDLDQVLNHKDNDVIYYWPLVNNQDIILQVENILKSDDNSVQIIQIIEQQYFQIKKQVNDQLDQYYKYLLKQVNQSSKQYVEGVYKNMINIDALKDCIISKEIKVDKINEIINSYNQKKQINSEILELAIDQYNQRKTFDILFTDLDKKLNILFEKINGRYMNFDNIDLVEQHDEKELQKALVLNYANKQLLSLNEKIKFQWQTFEEVQIGIQSYKSNQVLTKGYLMSNNTNEIDNLKHYNWWIQYKQENYYSKYLNYNKKAVNYKNTSSMKIKYNTSLSDQLNHLSQIINNIETKIKNISQNQQQQ